MGIDSPSLQHPLISALHHLHFSLAAFTFHLTAKEIIELPGYKGSAFRGGFGHIMKKVCCLAPGGKPCENCQLPKTCAYAYIFETPITDPCAAPIEATNLPHPFVLVPPLTPCEIIPSGEALSFGLTLIGKGVEFLPYFIYAFDELGRRGVGRGRGRYHLESVTDVFSHKEIYNNKTQTLTSDFTIKEFADILAESASHEGEQTVTLQFITPARVMNRERISNELPFDLLMRSLLRRASLLAKIHCGQTWELDYAAILDAARSHVRITQQKLRPQPWQRYSNRQKQRMRFDGFIGEVAYEGNLALFLPFIRLGHYIHIGKNTTFGMGKYEIQEQWQWQEQ